MKERPILMSAPMVHTILDGRKTQTRRIVKNNPYVVDYDVVGDCSDGTQKHYGKAKAVHTSKGITKCPYGQPGDRLWVRETWATTEQAGDHSADAQYVYRATDPNWQTMEGWKWKPSIFMPRAASRITLEITNVRVERLQDISERDAISEGISAYHPDGIGVIGVWQDYSNPRNGWSNPITSYKTLWEAINGLGSWNTNPWVWVIEFKHLIHI